MSPILPFLHPVQPTHHLYPHPNGTYQETGPFDPLRDTLTLSSVDTLNVLYSMFMAPKAGMVPVALAWIGSGSQLNYKHSPRGLEEDQHVNNLLRNPLPSFLLSPQVLL